MSFKQAYRQVKKHLNELYFQNEAVKWATLPKWQRDLLESVWTNSRWTYPTKDQMTMTIHHEIIAHDLDLDLRLVRLSLLGLKHIRAIVEYDHMGPKGVFIPTATIVSGLLSENPDHDPFYVFRDFIVSYKRAPGVKPYSLHYESLSGTEWHWKATIKNLNKRTVWRAFQEEKPIMTMRLFEGEENA